LFMPHHDTSSVLPSILDFVQDKKEQQEQHHQHS
jgi:hypothetical protein